MKGDTETMRPMKLTNKQIQEIVSDLRKQLKLTKTISGELNMSYKLPENKEHEKAKLIFTQEAWSKLTALVNTCSKEIAWHGIVEKNNNVYTITDILVFPQTVTGATVTSDETEYSMWLAQKPDHIFNKLRFHGHSHVNMGVSPSGVDTTYQEDILKNLNSFYIFAIFNKKGDHWCAIYDIESNMAYDKNDIELITPNTQTEAWAKEQMDRYVKEAAPVTPKTTAKKKDKKEEKPTGSYTDYLMNDDEQDWPGYGYYGYIGRGGYYGQK